ncbi:MAG: hypothetical protein EB027_03480 [Actinobacteria bacterium]|nr:hypothetical protein [Actinomycetota bacterium]
MRELLARIQGRVLGDVQPLMPLEMAVSAALRCVLSESVFTAADVAARFNDDTHPADTAVLPTVRPLVHAGTVVGPMHMQALLDAGVQHVSVHPQPRVVVVAVDEGTASARISALAAAVELTDAVSLPVQADADSDLEDVLDDQLVRADVLVVCGGWDDSGPALALEAARSLGGVDIAYTGLTALPVIGCGRVGAEPVPVLLLPADPVSQLIGFHVFLWPLIAALQGRAGAPLPTLQSVTTDEEIDARGLEPAEVHVAYASSRPLADGTRSVRCMHVRTPFAMADIDMLVLLPVGTQTQPGARVSAVALSQPGW